MPLNDPQIGEVWITSDLQSGREVQGILAEVAPTRVTFVSLTGNRHAVGTARLGTTWRFVQGVLTRPLPPCEREGCAGRGMLTYTRPVSVGRVHEGHVCPRHVPFASVCQITPTSPSGVYLASVVQACPCPQCGADPAEDLQINALPSRLWWCPSCRTRWVTVNRPLMGRSFEEYIVQARAELRRVRMEAETVRVLHQDVWATVRAIRNNSDHPSGPSQIDGLQATLDLGAVTEPFRGLFNALLMVRIGLENRRPVQRLGGAPSQGPPIQPALLDRLYHPTRGPDPAAALRATAQEAAARHALRNQERERDRQQPLVGGTTSETVEEVSPETLIEKDSLWLQRVGGMVVVILDTIKAVDGSEVVRFRQSTATESQPPMSMTRLDFLTIHKLFTALDVESTPLFNATVNEEWENVADHTTILITSIDSRRENVHGNDTTTGKHRSIPFTQFITNRWRKITRRSIYDRLRNPEIDFGDD